MECLGYFAHRNSSTTTTLKNTVTIIAFIDEIVCAMSNYVRSINQWLAGDYYQNNTDLIMRAKLNVRRNLTKLLGT